MSTLYLNCGLCGHKQANGLLSRAHWGQVDTAAGTLRACPKLQDGIATGRGASGPRPTRIVAAPDVQCPAGLRVRGELRQAVTPHRGVSAM